MTGRKTLTCAFTIRSETRYLAALRRWVNAMLGIAGARAGKRERIALQLALVEAVDNAIIHAHNRRARLPLRLQMSVSEGEAAVEVVDTGAGMGEPSGALPDAMSSRGRGLFLINSMMTRTSSVRRRGRHVLKMRLKLRP